MSKPTIERLRKIERDCRMAPDSDPAWRIAHDGAADACKAEAEKLERAERAGDSLREDVVRALAERVKWATGTAGDRVWTAMLKDFAARKWPGFDAKEGS